MVHLMAGVEEGMPILTKFEMILNGGGKLRTVSCANNSEMSIGACTAIDQSDWW